jgi:anti-repressor protein
MELQKLDSEKKYTSLYLVEQINLFRSQESERSVLLHKNLLVKIETEFFDEIAELKFQPSSYKDSSGKECKCYELNYEQSLQILMSESKVVRKGVIEVLKAQQNEINKLKSQLPDFTNPALMAREWATQYETIEKQKLELESKQKFIEESKPKLFEYEVLMDSDTSISIGQFSKMLQIGRNNIFDLMREKKILISGGREHNLPYQKYIDAGYFEVKESTINPKEGVSFIKQQTLVTPKGQSYLLNKLIED